MSAAVALTPRHSLNDVGTYRPSQQTASHEGHGCCQDRARFGPLARSQGRGAVSLVGFGTYSPDRPTLPVMAFGLRCRSWACPCCAVRLRRRARARAFMGASGAKVALLTLTIDPSDGRFADPRNRAGKDRPRSSSLIGSSSAETVEHSTRYASWAWNRFRTYLVREYGAVPFFRGLELQQSGMAHLHVLLRVRDATEFMQLRSLIRGPETDRASGLAVRAGFGLVVDMQLARSGGDVARYVTKTQAAGDAAAYATKGVPAALPRYTRRTAWSLTTGRAPWAAGWVKPTPIAGFTWRVARCTTETVLGALPAEDFHVVDPESYRVRSGPSGPGGNAV